MSTLPIIAAVALYCTAWILLVRGARRRVSTPPPLWTWILAAGILMHGIGIAAQLRIAGGYELSLFKIFSLFLWVTNGLLLVSGLRQPLQNLFAITLPLSVIALLVSWHAPGGKIIPADTLTPGMATHILLSILAYSVMIVASLQAVVLAFQNKRLRERHPGGLVRLLPPLETMERLLFELLWVGQLLLTLVIATGAVMIYNLAAQHLYHKITFTICAWLIYAVLLWGRHRRGWRGQVAIRWTLAGSACLLLAYLGTKLVLELLLN